MDQSSPKFQQCLDTKGPDFKGRYVYAKLVYYNNTDSTENTGLLPDTTVPRGGWYWTQDIMETLPKYPLIDFVLENFEDFQSMLWLNRGAIQ